MCQLQVSVNYEVTVAVTLVGHITVLRT